ncbi:MAG: ATP synthase subunit C [Faecalibacterium sp.]|nr:ATP synthase subunit C [Ruminococcus sp.]MCM1392627.1 ATP synthase subunit C [Ruminococcus sp.]MCM1486066.1 ATP synthase subunit C [Faecalibacterium sp.]
MSTFFYAAIIIVPAIVLMLSAFFTFKRRMEGKSIGKTMRINLVTFLVLILLVGTCTFMASAETGRTVYTDNAASVSESQPASEAAEETADSGSSAKGLGLLAAGLVTGLAGIGGGIAVAAGAPAAIAATSEDPKSFGKSLIFVALGESIALYGVVISILILNKV